MPQPDGPTKTMNSPSLTSRFTPLTTSIMPKVLTTFFRESCPKGGLLTEKAPGRTNGAAGTMAYLYCSRSAAAFFSASAGSAVPVTTDCTSSIITFCRPL